MYDVTTNDVKRLLKDGKPTAGAWLQACSPIAADVLAGCGFDWLLIDMEHSPLNFESLMMLVMAIQGRKAVPFVRAPWNDFVSIKRILDTGVYGILVPYVSTKEEAEQAVRSCKYPPLGIRGVAASPRGSGYGSSLERIKKANDEICVITQIETYKAVENIDEILTVEGLDGLFIGPMDLSTSMGHMGNPKHPEVQEAIAEVERKVFASDKFLGTITSSWEDAEPLYDKGYQFITLMADATALGALGRQRMKMFNEKFSDGKNF
jgi:2-keto-3-deoxy-L-rhamnonate aldolase RhmA